jgi:hypothetical protein
MTFWNVAEKKKWEIEKSLYLLSSIRSFYKNPISGAPTRGHSGPYPSPKPKRSTVEHFRIIFSMQNLVMTVDGKRKNSFDLSS